MPEIVVVKRLIDYVGLSARAAPEEYLKLFKDVGVVLALNEAMGPDGAVLFNADAAGNLLVTSPVGQPASQNLTQWASNALGGPSVPADGMVSAVNMPRMLDHLMAFNNAAWDRLRTASASNQAATSGVGALVTTPTGEWAVTSAPAAGSQASASRVAGGAGVRHILKGFGFAAGSIVAPALTPLLINVRDGASGAGTILKSIVVIITAVVGQNIPPIEVSGLNVIGSANTAMTVEFSAALANLSESVSLSGFDTI